MNQLFPLLPLRDIVVFPGQVVSLFVGRQKSVAALESAMEGDKDIFLLAQLVTNFRNTLAAQYPGLKPAISASCKLLGCKVELPAQIEHLGMETGELQSLSPTSFQLTTLLRNEGTLIQAWPHIELELTDAADKPVVRRVFTPAQYLPSTVAVAKGFAGRSEQTVKIQFELKQVKASGFHIAVFYP